MIVNVGDIADQIRGVSYAKSEAVLDPSPGVLPVLRANNITDDGLTFQDLIYVPESRISDAQTLRENDIIIAASSGSLDVVGKAAQLRKPFQGAFGAFCKVLRPDTSLVDPAYFSHFFRTRAYRQKISSLAAGVNINNLKNEHLDELEILLPSLCEQRRIAAILDKADALRGKRRRSLELTSEMASALTHQYLSGREVELGSVIIEGPTNGLYKPSKDYGDGTPILRIDSFYDGRIVNIRSLKRLNVSSAEMARFELRVGDIIVNRVNSLEYLGKSALVRQLLEPTVFESNMMRFSLNTTALLPEVCIALLQTSDVRKQVLGKAKNAVNQSSINQGDVKSLRIPLPNMEQQCKFVECIERLESTTAGMVEGEAKSASLFSSLQQRAFSGQL